MYACAQRAGTPAYDRRVRNERWIVDVTLVGSARSTGGRRDGMKSGRQTGRRDE